MTTKGAERLDAEFTLSIIADTFGTCGETSLVKNTSKPGVEDATGKLKSTASRGSSAEVKPNDGTGALENSNCGFKKYRTSVLVGIETPDRVRQVNSTIEMLSLANTLHIEIVMVAENTADAEL